MTFSIPADQLPAFMKKKIQPSFYIFKKDEAGNDVRVGAAFAHKRGKGMNIIINGERYSLFPPKQNTENSEA